MYRKELHRLVVMTMLLPPLWYMSYLKTKYERDHQFPPTVEQHDEIYDGVLNYTDGVCE